MSTTEVTTTGADTKRRPVDYEAIKEVSAEVQLVDISTVAFSAQATRPLVGLRAGDLDQLLRYRAARQTDGGEKLLVKVEFEYTASSEGQTLAIVTGIFVALYSTGPLVSASSPDLRDTLSEVNGLYNTWSYLRELVSSSLSRLGLTGVLIPLWRPPTSLPPRGEYETLRSAPLDESPR